MLLKLYNLEHVQIAGLKNHKNATVESELSTGDKTLSFLWHQNNWQRIPHEYYIRTDTDEFVVKENSKTSNGYRKIVAKLNIETIEGRGWREFTLKGCTAQEAADYALTDTGWICRSTVSKDRIRNISMKKVSSYQVLEKIQDAFTCEIEYDTINKIVYLKEKVGADKGVCFIDGLNLLEVTDSGDSYDYATIIVPIGADDLSIESVNNGNNFLENYQYSKKKITMIWEDSSYTDPQALKDDAEYKLNEISKPKKTYRVKIVDLAKRNKKYSGMEYSVGDTVTIISLKDGIKEKQRITKTTEYLEKPVNNTCDISNAVLSFEDMQKKLFAAAECIDNITTDNGTVKGSSIDSIDVTQIIGLERYIAEDINDLKAEYLYVKKELGAVAAVIGEATITSGKITNLTVTDEEVETSHIKDLKVDSMTGENAVFKTVEAENINALEERVNKITATDITVEYLEAHYAQIDYANVDVASIKQGFLKNLMVSQGIVADRIVGSEVTATNVLTGVNIYADDITAGTLSVDRLVFRGSEQSIVYQLNQINGALQAENVDTINGEVITPRTITADRIIAKTITSNEINVENLVATGLVETNRLTSKNIEVEDLFAMDIIAAGSIQSANYKYTSGTYSSAGIKINMANGGIASRQFAIDTSGNAYFAGNLVAAKGTFSGKLSAPEGSIGGFTIGTKALYSGTDSMTSVVAGVYLGTDGIRQYKSAKTYTQIENGKLTCVGADIKGNIYLDSSLMMWHENDEGGYGARYEEALSWVYNTGMYKLKLGGQGCTTNYLDVYEDITCNGNIYGNSSTAEKLKTQRSIKVGNTSTTFDGSANVSWTLAEIGAAASNHTHAYLPLAGGTLTGSLDIASGKYIHGTHTNGTILDILGLNKNNNCHVGNNTTPTFLHGAGYQLDISGAFICPNVSNQMSCGTKNKLWTTVFSKTGAINTSDRTKKHNIIDLTEAYEQLFLKLKPKSFIFNDGDRVHIGAISQDVEDAMQKLGIEPEKFAGFCKDIRYEYTEYNEEDGMPIESSKVPCKDEDGNIIYDYALRYQEFIFLTVHMVQKLWKRVDVVEKENAEIKEQIRSMRQDIEELKKVRA